jgi:predicted membrane protein DUF2085
MTVAAMRMFRRACALSAVAWALALPLAAWLASRPDGRGGGGYAFAFGTYAVGSLVCHQRPERSFFLFGIQMPVCARCLGLYVSAALAALGATAMPVTATRVLRIPARARAPWRSIDSARLMLAASSLPTIATLAYEWITGTMPANVIRAASAAPLGAVVGWLLTRPARGRGEIN